MCSPASKEELFNLRHSSARNIIERIFGVLKRRFRILLLAPEYQPEIQARIPAALCALHNFIQHHDPSEGELPGEDVPFGYRDDSGEALGGEHDVRRDRIATEMWTDYQRVLQERGSSGSDDDEEEEEFFDSNEEWEGEEEE